MKRTLTRCPARMVISGSRQVTLENLHPDERRLIGGAGPKRSEVTAARGKAGERQ